MRALSLARIHITYHCIHEGTLRERILSWLAWNDRNGVYLDEDAIAEWGVAWTLVEAWEFLKTVMEEA